MNNVSLAGRNRIIESNKKRGGYINPKRQRICQNDDCRKAFLARKPSQEAKYCCHRCSTADNHNTSRREIELKIPEIKIYRRTHNQEETASYFDLSLATLQRWGIRGHHFERRQDLPDRLTDEQHEVLVGNLLGDGYLSRTVVEGRNSNFAFNQSVTKKEYVLGLRDIYSPFSTIEVVENSNRNPARINGKINHDVDNWDGRFTKYCRLRTVTHRVFTDYRMKWYKSVSECSKKIIPSDLHLTWRSVAIWACDDGYNANTISPSMRQRGYTIPSRKFVLYTDGFTVAEVEFLIDRLRDDLGIIGRLNFRNSKPHIVMLGDNKEYFVDGIKPFIPWECMQYKCRNYKKDEV